VAFDSSVVAATTRELATILIGGRIDKVQQPAQHELILQIYAGGAQHRLLLSCHAQHARFHLTQQVRKNPQTPPTFCMLMRKYVEGGRIVALEQPGRERMLRLKVQVTDELGNPAVYTLVAETMGKHSNIVLVAPDGRIVDAVRRVTEEVNRHRELLPGVPYLPPPATGKPAPETVTAPWLAGVLTASGTSGKREHLWQALLGAVDGLSPLLAREVVHRAGMRPTSPAPLGADQAADLVTALQGLLARWQAGEFTPTLLLDAAGNPADFAAFPLAHWEHGQQTAGSFSLLLDRFFAAREETDRWRTEKGQLAKLVSGELDRCRRKEALQAEALARAEAAEEYRIRAELLTAHLWQVKKGDKEVRVVNYYDEQQRELTIELDPQLTPAENAQALYRKYTRAKSGRAATEAQLAATRDEIAYLEQVEAALAAAQSLPDLAEVRNELVAEGYLTEKHDEKSVRTGKGGRAPGRGARAGKGEGHRPQPPLTLTSADGWTIWVGRNNRQNDYLTLRLAENTDLWLHTQKIPGSHVIVRVPPGAEVPERTLREAAALAAYFSKARDSAQVPVDYTLRKHVRKPAGARPGMVIYDNQRTIYITPDPAAYPILNSAASAAGKEADPS
jgi:predicted ribosome quality control (RQC) complex YloA/Tae2 family protein